LSSTLNYFLVATLTLYIIGAIFKLYYWAGADILVYTGYAAAFILPTILIMQKNAFSVSQQYVITFFTYFILLIAQFPNNPIAQSPGNSSNYRVSKKTAAAMEEGNTVNVTSPAGN
jgi:hypothetical protein